MTSILIQIPLLLVASILIIKLITIFLNTRCNSYTTLINKTVIVTGANTGIGYYAALDFAKRGARVILACRNREKAEAARHRIQSETGNSNIVVKIVDLASFASVRAFAKDVNTTEERLDILVNNAGLAMSPRVKTEDGHYILTQSNYLSPFLLTNLLIGLLIKTGSSRVVNVASFLAFLAIFNVEDLHRYQTSLLLYSKSKLCNILFSKELSKRLKGTGVTSYSLHPGTVKTDIFQPLSGFLKFVFTATDFLQKTSEEGAQTIIHLAVAKDIEKFSGEHFHECKKMIPYWNVNLNPGLSGILWNKSVEMVQLKAEEMQI